MRKSVYLRDKMDDDILEVVKPLLKNHSFAHVMRELARDGIKYRKGGGGVVSHKIIQSITPEQPAPILDIKLNKKGASDNDIASRLDNF